MNAWHLRATTNQRQVEYRFRPSHDYLTKKTMMLDLLDYKTLSAEEYASLAAQICELTAAEEKALVADIDAKIGKHLQMVDRLMNEAVTAAFQYEDDQRLRENQQKRQEEELQQW